MKAKAILFFVDVLHPLMDFVTRPYICLYKVNQETNTLVKKIFLFFYNASLIRKDNEILFDFNAFFLVRPKDALFIVSVSKLIKLFFIRNAFVSHISHFQGLFLCYYK